jgi:general secretion pathway protein J
MTEAHALRNPAMRPSVRQSIRQSTSASRARGFTLVEVIVALAILSLVMLATVSGFRTLGNTATTIGRMTDRSDELRSVSSFLRDAFENSVTGEGAGESASNASLSFGGNSGMSPVPVRYLKLAPAAVEWRSKVLFGESYGGSYFLRLATREQRLELQWQDPDGKPEPEDWARSPSREVLDGVQQFEVWHRMSPSAPWQQTVQEDELPSHVKLVIKANDKFWPDLVMQVQ